MVRVLAFIGGAVILLCVAVAVAMVPHFRYYWRVEEQRQARIRDDLERIRDAAEIFFSRENRYPSGVRELADILGEWPLDPWGNEYLIEVQREGVFVLCLGNDGRRGGSGVPAQDVVITLR